MPSPDTTAKLAYSVKEAAAATTLSRNTVYGHIAAGRIKAVRIGRRMVIPREELFALLEGSAT